MKIHLRTFHFDNSSELWQFEWHFTRPVRVSACVCQRNYFRCSLEILIFHAHKLYGTKKIVRRRFRVCGQQEEFAVKVIVLNRIQLDIISFGTIEMMRAIVKLANCASHRHWIVHTTVSVLALVHFVHSLSPTGHDEDTLTNNNIACALLVCLWPSNREWCDISIRTHY